MQTLLSFGRTNFFKTDYKRSLSCGLSPYMYLFNLIGVVLRKKLSPDTNSPFIPPSEGFLRYVTGVTVQVEVFIPVSNRRDMGPKLVLHNTQHTTTKGLANDLLLKAFRVSI